MSRILKFNEKKNNPKDGDILDEGKFGKLNYVLFKRGVIHISNGKNTFKKDADKFEDLIENLDLNNMTSGQKQTIEGSGDNPNLVFTCDGENMKISIEVKEYALGDKIKKVLGKLTTKKSAANG